MKDVVAAAGRNLAPGEPAVELVADNFVALAAKDSASALSGAVVGSGGAGRTTVNRNSLGSGGNSGVSSSRALPVRRFVARRSPQSAAAAVALAALSSASSPALAPSSSSGDEASSRRRRGRTLFQGGGKGTETATETAALTPTSTAVVAPVGEGQGVVDAPSRRPSLSQQ